MQSHREQEYMAALALRHCPKLGARTWKKLLCHYGGAAEAVGNVGRWLEHGLASQSQCREFQARTWQSGAQREADAAHGRRMDVVLWVDPEYPELLRDIPGPPALLYVLGDKTLLSGPCVAIVGSRKSSRYGMDAARAISLELSQAGICVVSGFAAGIDRQAHAAALEGVGTSIAVLGTGLDLMYPAENRDIWLQLRDKGLIITEFAPGTRPDAINFPHRNRIISGLSLGVLVIEAAVRSGSLITAGTALEQGREVFALPGPVNQESYAGCHHLIRQGATLVSSAQDILTELRPLLESKGMNVQQEQSREQVPGQTAAGPMPQPMDPAIRWPDQNPGDLLILSLLHDQGKTHIDTICEALDQDPAEVSKRLLLLEMRSLVTQYPGMYYQLR
jgi:DNA processing protein